MYFFALGRGSFRWIQGGFCHASWELRGVALVVRATSLQNGHFSRIRADQTNQKRWIDAKDAGCHRRQHALLAGVGRHLALLPVNRRTKRLGGCHAWLMGDLAGDTAVDAVADGLWRGRLSEDWNVWGPNGGYVASFCLRAAGAACGLARPATIACHYLAVAGFDEIDLHVAVLRRTRRTAAVRVHMTQGGSPIADATVWAVADGLDGYTWNDTAAPEGPGPDNTPRTHSRHAMGRNLDQRPIDVPSTDDLSVASGGPHQARTWMRFLPTATFEDPWIDACRLLILIDTWAWPAAISGVPEDTKGRFLAPNLDVTARFHGDARSSPWLLADARAPVAGDGLIGAEVAVWTDDARLVASGGAQLLCRPGSSVV